MVDSHLVEDDILPFRFWAFFGLAMLIGVLISAFFALAAEASGTGTAKPSSLGWTVGLSISALSLPAVGWLLWRGRRRLGKTRRDRMYRAIVILICLDVGYLILIFSSIQPY